MRSDSLDWRPLIGAEPAKADGQEVIEVRRVKCDVTEPLFKRLLRRLFPDQRKQERILVPPLVGYLGTVRSTKAYEVGDISLSGFCLLTDEQWTPGTEMPITLERIKEDDPETEFFTVQATVVRIGTDGVGFSVLLSESESKAAHGNPLKVRWASRPEMERFLRSLKEEPETLGQACTESLDAKMGMGSAGSPFDVRRHGALPQMGSD
jgi:hypothetical protein